MEVEMKYRKEEDDDRYKFIKTFFFLLLFLSLGFMRLGLSSFRSHNVANKGKEFCSDWLYELLLLQLTIETVSHIESID
ncbi:hypothetical protein OIU77_030775 [Salix suchowensis]|uniref:Uncharacterized protein n=1 Tax=Salix suchowensis TaxID=1278906 RepID=A0ABQ9BD74_9ROSI|nr:hypothetical protein OIU77_030775 [Salix suchowensis]